MTHTEEKEKHVRDREEREAHRFDGNHINPHPADKYANRHDRRDEHRELNEALDRMEWEGGIS